MSPEAAGTACADRCGETPAVPGGGLGARNGEGPRAGTRERGRGRRTRGRAGSMPARTACREHEGLKNYQRGSAAISLVAGVARCVPSTSARHGLMVMLATNLP
jgi:hypothetical protein